MIRHWTMPAAARTAVVAFALLVVALVGSADAATLQQQRSWGGPGSDAAEGVAVAADGATYLAGNTTSFSADGSTAVFVVKFAADGSLAWQRTYESPVAFGSDTARAAAVAPDGSVYVTGSTFGVGGDVLLLKFSPEGTLLWQQRWGGSGFEAGDDVAVAADGAVYVVGDTSTFGTGNDVAVLKFASDGALVWQRTWGPASGDGIAVGSDGNLYVAGTASRPGGIAQFDAALLSIDPTGTLRWQRQYAAGDSVDARGGVAVGDDGSIALAGALTTSGRTADMQASLVKFSSEGTLEWDRGWGGKSGDTGEGVAIAGDGTVLLAGNTNSFGSGIDDAFLLRLEANGRRIDASLFGGAAIDHANDVAVASDGTIQLGGSLQTPPWVFQDGAAKVSRLRGTVSTPTTPLGTATGATADPGGTVATPAGSTTYAGSDDAGLLRIVS